MSEAEQERAAIVAWLRNENKPMKVGSIMSSIAEDFASAIERGEHLRANAEGDS